MTTKKYLQRDWLRFKTFKPATEKHGKMKIDDDGNIIEWIASGKRPTCKIIRKIECNYESHLLEKLDGQIFCSECQINLNCFI